MMEQRISVLSHKNNELQPVDAAQIQSTASAFWSVELMNIYVVCSFSYSLSGRSHAWLSRRS
jgi:hypothetical protein